MSNDDIPSDEELQAELDAIDPASVVPLSEDRIAEMVAYATDPRYRAIYHRARDAERALDEVERELCQVRHLALEVYRAWLLSESDLGIRMQRLEEAIERPLLTKAKGIPGGAEVHSED